MAATGNGVAKLWAQVTFPQRFFPGSGEMNERAPSSELNTSPSAGNITTGGLFHYRRAVRVAIDEMVPRRGRAR